MINVCDFTAISVCAEDVCGFAELFCLKHDSLKDLNVCFSALQKIRGKNVVRSVPLRFHLLGHQQSTPVH
jgi:hypothetical protein